MDFSLTSVFVNPVGGTLASAGGTSALAPGKIGFFKKSYTAPAVAADTRFIVAQGRQPNEVPQTSKKSDVIDTGRIIRYSKFPAITTAVNKIVTITNLKVKCGEEVSITLRAFSKYLNASFANGLTRTFTVLAPCCDCDADDCLVLDPSTIVDEFVAKINASIYKDYLVATKTGTGATTGITLTGKTLPQDPISANMGNFIYDGLDVVDFFAYTYKGAETTMDELVEGRCNVFADVATTQRATYTRGSAKEVSLVEQRHYSYQSGAMKDLNCDMDMNPTYASYTVPGTWYDQFLIKFRPLEGNQTWAMHQEIDETVIIYVAQAQTAAFTTALDGLMKATAIENEY